MAIIITGRKKQLASKRASPLNLVFDRMPILERDSVSASRPTVSNPKVEEFEKLQKDQDSATSVDYRTSFLTKLSKKSLFFVIIPAIPVLLLFLCLLLLIDTRTITYTPSSTTSSTVESTTPANAPTTPKPIYRFPTNLIPSMYILDLRVYLPYRKGVDFGHLNQTISASVIINFHCKENTSQIVLNQNDLLLDNSTIQLADQNTMRGIPVFISNIDNKAKIVEFVVDDMLEKGRNYTFFIRYKTRMRPPSDGGLFLASYKVGNETRYHAVSQMQPLDAKRVFPCFDDPSFKAVFQINIIHPSGTTAISNTEVFKRTSLKNGWTKTEFEMTPIMSTYLLAMAITDFDYIEDKYRNITLRIWAAPDSLPYCGYALGLLSKALSFYEDYFNISYPLSKLDVYAVPELRVVGMENWGMIAIQTSILVYDPNFTSIADKGKTVMTVFHEVAHMWFGNLVTMRWWNDLWLNEGFACHMSRIAMQNLSDPLIDIDHLFNYLLWPIVGRDEERAVSVLSPDTQYENSITGVFNGASYYKGEAIIQMIKKVTGDKFFQRTLQNFIKTHLYDNVISDDLANSLTRALEVYDHNNPFDGMPVSQVMKSWTHKKGFPTIVVKTINKTTVSLQQTSYHSGLREFTNDSWITPVFYKDDLYSNEQKIVWLKDNRTVLLNNMAVIDPDFYGYYRVMYDKDGYQKLTNTLMEDHEAISKAGRSKIIYESFTFQRFGILTTEPLDLVQYVTKEVHEGPLMILCNFLESLHSMFPDDANYKEYKLHLLVPVYERVNQNKNEREYEQVRRILTQRLCSWGYQKCIDHAIKEFALLMKECKNNRLSSSCNQITPTLRTGIYSMAVKYGPPEYFDILWEKYLLESNVFESERIRYGLTGTIIPSKIEKVVSYQMYNDTKMIEPHALWIDFFNNGNLEHLRPVLQKHLHKYITYILSSSSHLNYYPKPKILKFLSTMIMAFYKVLPTPENLEQLDKYDKIIEPLIPPNIKGLLKESRKNALKEYQLLLKNRNIYEQYFRDFAIRKSRFLE